MLRAITDTTLNIDSGEYLLDAVPNRLLTDDELAQVRRIHANALHGYVARQGPAEARQKLPWPHLGA